MISAFVPDRLSSALTLPSALLPAHGVCANKSCNLVLAR